MNSLQKQNKLKFVELIANLKHNRDWFLCFGSDTNECLSRNGHGPCQGHCTNMEGSYVCSCEGMPGTQIADDGISCRDIDECSEEEYLLGCSHKCINTLGTAFCICPSGYQLETDWRTCRGYFKIKKFMKLMMPRVTTIVSYSILLKAEV